MMQNNFDLWYEYPSFNELNDKGKQKLWKFCRELCFYPGDTLYEDGEPAKKLFLLADGEVEVFYAVGEAGIIQVDRIGPGEIFGRSALFPPYLHTSTARAISHIEVLQCDADDFCGLCDDDPEFSIVIQQNVFQSSLAHIVDLQS
jgi:CRP-like cAMP-binding protein